MSAGVDLAPVSTVGVRTEAGVALGEDEPIKVLQAQIDADVAIGGHVKAFASFPIVAARAFGDSTVGTGNLEVGALGAFGEEGWRVGAGAAVGYGATADGHLGVLLHFDLPAFDPGEPVLRGFVSARVGPVGLTVEHAHYLDTELPGARVGLTLPVGEYRLGAELRAAEDFEDGRAAATLVALDLGLRGRFPGMDVQTWTLHAGVAHFDGLTTPSLGIEIRTW